MADHLEECMPGHTAVRWNDEIVVLNKINKCGISIYNLFTERWRIYTLPKGKCLPVQQSQRGVQIGSDVYVFGGSDPDNMLWKLMRSTNSSFDWELFHTDDCSDIPSPRVSHCVWEYDEEMWVFGGYGEVTDDYLRDHGDFKTCEFHFLGVPSEYNNQLFCFTPSSQAWENVACCGDVPAPRSQAASAIIKSKFYIHGGDPWSMPHRDDLYELDMHSITWTRIKTTGPGPKGQSSASLTPLSTNQLVFCGAGKSQVFDVQSATWKTLCSSKTIYHRWDHMCTTGIHNSVIILELRKYISIVNFEPRSLQQQSMEIVRKLIKKRNKWFTTKVPLERLPKKLVCKIMGTDD